MTLHLEQLLADIQAMNEQATSTERQTWLEAARRLMRAYDPDRLALALARNGAERRALLAPAPRDPLATRVAAPPAPLAYGVVAADGSSIAPDRNGPGRYYVLNTGLVTLRYGDVPSATIEARAEMGYRREELYWGKAYERPVDERRLSLLMRVREIEQLADAVEGAGYPAVAMVDGQLVMWALQAEQEEDRGWLLGRLITALDRLHEYGVPLVGYISDTESFELVNALRCYLCPTTPSGCQRCRPVGPDDVQLCYHLRGARDPSLLFPMLEAGERSGLFESQATILRDYPARHQVLYFFICTGDEIARVELPRWVADDPTLLALVHGVLWDQCGRCRSFPPYPPVLHEAHEAAVISHGDREALSHMIESQLQREGHYHLRPAKAWHKRRRSV